MVCNTDLKARQVTNVLFYDCSFEIKGVINDGEKRLDPWRSTESQGYITFEDEGP